MKRFLLLSVLSGCALIAKPQSPGSPSNIEFSDGAFSTGWIDFDFYHGNQIYVPVTINGHPAIAWLVTGLSTVIMDKDFADSIGLQPESARTADSATADIRLGNLTLHQVKVTLTLSKSKNHRRDLILSDALFSSATVDIDFARHRLACYPPTSFVRPAGAVELPLSRAADSRSVPVSVEAGPPIPCEIFLGDPAPLTVYEAYEKSHGLLGSRPHSVRLGGGGTGKYPREAVAALKNIRFAGIDFSQVPAVFPTDSVRGSSSTLVSGNIGMAVLSRFRLLFDYSHDRLYAVPYSRTAMLPLAKDRSGLFLVVKEGRYTVAFVAPGSPALLAGFQPGDTIRLIDQKTVQTWQGLAWQSPALGTLRPAPAGITFTFTMEDGSLRQLKTADYF